MNKIVYILWTCRSLEEAQQIIASLLQEKLIACASILPHTLSYYWWNGTIEKAEEVKVFLKTTHGLFDRIQQTIEQQCSYQTPEIVQLDMSNTAPSYEGWILSTLQQQPEENTLNAENTESP